MKKRRTKTSTKTTPAPYDWPKISNVVCAGICLSSESLNKANMALPDRFSFSDQTQDRESRMKIIIKNLSELL